MYIIIIIKYNLKMLIKKSINLSALFLLSISFNSIAADDIKFRCELNIVDNMQNVYYSDIWDIKDSEPNDDYYHDLIYKNSTNPRGYNLYQKSHIFYKKETQNLLYLKSDIKYDYKSSLGKEKVRKEFKFKDKLRLGEIKTYSNGTNNLSIICNRK